MADSATPAVKLEVTSKLEAVALSSGAGDGLPRAWLEIDINETRAAYKRAVDFVEANNLTYNLTSNWLEELGGSEKRRIKEVLYPGDFAWAQKGRVCVRQPPERLTFELWPDLAPLAVQNFLSLVTGHRGVGAGGRPLHYKSGQIHRLVPNFIVQGVMNNGSGGESIFGKPFKDDKDGLKKKLDVRGLLAMGNSGKNSNTSQFFITLDGGKGVQVLTGKHVVFGRLVDGEQVLQFIESCAADDGSEKPQFSVVIANCGVEAETLTQLQRHQCGLA
ncbi:cyclophilin-like domain-containing protein [Pavlovales sp. CCMP2436]|nr:cyclophilin-like domain-containing protein [Pavlovales sp. CCMP2436]